MNKIGGEKKNVLFPIKMLNFSSFGTFWMLPGSADRFASLEPLK